MKVKNTCNCCIEKLLRKSFASFVEKQHMVNIEKPTTIMNITIKNKYCTKHFTVKLYKTNNWGTGCKYLNK